MRSFVHTDSSETVSRSRRAGRLLPGSRPLLVLGALFVLGGGQVQAQAGSRGPDPQRRAAIQRQQAEAMVRLSDRQRRDYFEARRDLERRRSINRLDQFSQLERCVQLARDVASMERCQRTVQEQRMAQRRQEMVDLDALQRRYGLPSWAGGKGGRNTPAPRPLGPSSSALPPYYPPQQGYIPTGQAFLQPHGQVFVHPHEDEYGESGWMGDILQSLFF